VAIECQRGQLVGGNALYNLFLGGTVLDWDMIFAGFATQEHESIPAAPLANLDVKELDRSVVLQGVVALRYVWQHLRRRSGLVETA
jgi:hypothetical protein